MKAWSNHGFTLAEFVIAIVFIGVVLGPFLIFVARIHDLNSAIGQQGRREAWRSFNDQVLAAGIDPTQAPALTAAVNAAVPAVPAGAVAQTDVPAVPGVARIIPLHVVLDGSMAEARMAGAGYQIGAGAGVAPRSTPTSPLTPIVMPLPVITPPDGTAITPTSLAATTPGQPYTIVVQAASDPGTKISLTLNQPFSSVQGSGIAQQTVTAADLLEGVNGIAWTEYPGTTEAGEQPVALADGRTRWLVKTSEGRLQIYEPSPMANFVYQIALGAPVLVWGAMETVPGGSLTFDYRGYYEIQSGVAALKIDFPRAVKAVFGNAWPERSVGFQCGFHGVAGPFSGNLSAFFQPDALSLWADAVTVGATPVAPRGAVVEAGSWTLARITTALGVPLLTDAADQAGFYSPGKFQFSAPPGPGGTPLGRLSFQNGTTVSTGPTLSIAVTP